MLRGTSIYQRAIPIKYFVSNCLIDPNFEVKTNKQTTIFNVLQYAFSFIYYFRFTVALPGEDLGGGCRGAHPPPPLLEMKLKICLPHGQWRHSLEMHPLPRKILDPPLSLLYKNKTITVLFHLCHSFKSHLKISARRLTFQTNNYSPSYRHSYFAVICIHLCLHL